MSLKSINDILTPHRNGSSDKTDSGAGHVTFGAGSECFSCGALRDPHLPRCFQLSRPCRQDLLVRRRDERWHRAARLLQLSPYSLAPRREHVAVLPRPAPLAAPGIQPRICSSSFCPVFSRSSCRHLLSWPTTVQSNHRTHRLRATRLQRLGDPLRPGSPQLHVDGAALHLVVALLHAIPRILLAPGSQALHCP